MPDRGASASPIRSVTRAFAILEVLADREDDVSLTAIAAELGLAVPTAFRIMRTLVAAGYARHLPSRRYGLGTRLIRLGERTSQRLGTWVLPTLTWLVAELHETANLAVLDRDMVVYLAQVPSGYEMRMFAEVGHRVHAHSSAVGKAMLATMTDHEVRALLGRAGMPGHTPSTYVIEDDFLAELARIRSLGYAVDDGEQEIGVRCLATSIPGLSTRAAISISGPSTRVPIAATARYTEVLTDAAEMVAEFLAGNGHSLSDSAMSSARAHPCAGGPPQSSERSPSPATAHSYHQLWQ